MKILLAVDESQPSQAAVDELMARKWPKGTTVDVVTVVEPGHLWTTSEAAESVFAQSAELLRLTLEQVRKAGFEAAANGDVLRGDPKTVILDRAAELTADLIIVGSHAMSAVEHFLLGNVGANVLRHAHCSVLLARARPMMGEARKILLATDGSASSMAAARMIAYRPWAKGTEVRVLSVVELVLPAAQAMLEPPFIESRKVEELREAAMKHAQEAVDSALKVLEGHVMTSESISVLLERPKALILKEAKEWEADLIVMGSHGRSGLDRFLLGSVSEAVATHADCSVEVVRG